MAIITLTLIAGEEKIPLNFDFTNHKVIQQGATITGTPEITIVPATGVTIESPTIDPTGKIVQALFTPTSAATYSVCCKVTTTIAAKPKIAGILQVKEC